MRKDRSHLLFDLGMLILTLCALCLWSSRAEALGWEKVKVLYIQNAPQSVCQQSGSTAAGPSSKVPEQSAFKTIPRSALEGKSCQRVLRYLITVKRGNGTSTEVLMVNRPTSEYILVRFCSGLQGTPDYPCSN